MTPGQLTAARLRANAERSTVCAQQPDPGDCLVAWGGHRCARPALHLEPPCRCACDVPRAA